MAPSKKPTLVDLLGPTPLALTHRSGLAEKSVRRIKAVFPPNARTGDAGSTDTRRVAEANLDAKLAKVVMAPWIGWCDGEAQSDQSSPPFYEPVMFPPSTGHEQVQDPQQTTMDLDVVDSVEVIPPHDAQSDDITVLVSPSLVSLFQDGTGMGLAATWLEIAPASVQTSTPGDVPPAKSHGSFDRSLWYMEGSPEMVLPSFYTEKNRPPF